LRKTKKCQEKTAEMQDGTKRYPLSLHRVLAYQPRIAADDGGYSVASIVNHGRPMHDKTASKRCELLKIDGRLVEIKIKLNPRARRPIVKVNPSNGEVSVIVPSPRALEHALRFVRGEADWIAHQLACVPPPVLLQPGARIPLRGTDHKIVPGDGRTTRLDEPARVIRVGGRLEHAPRRLIDFLKCEARRDFETRVLAYSAQIGVHPRRIVLRDTRSRWGSCSAARYLSFSWRLVLAPPFVLDYVAAHETAHLREMNHGPKFWALVRDLIGDVERPQDWLRQNGAGLHRYRDLR
jgi:predicted metal-dependent hydrolase